MLPDDLKMALRARKLSGAFEKWAPGRAFLRHLIDLAIGVRSPNFSICPTRSAKDAVNVWLPLPSFPRPSFFHMSGTILTSLVCILTLPAL